MMSLCVLFFGFALAETAAPTWYRAFVATGDGADPMTGCGCYNNATCNKQASGSNQCAAVAGDSIASQAHDCLKCRCDWRDPAVSWVANTKGNSAIIGNGGGYPLEMGKNCVGGDGKSDIYDMYMTWALKQDGRRLQSSSTDPVGPKPTAGKWAALDFQDPSGKQLKNQVVSIAIGHGLFNGQCQQCYIVQVPKEIGNDEDRYMALMQVDVRAWSFEFTQDSQCYLDQSICYGGGCLIPNAMMVDCKDIVNNSIPSLKMTGVQRYSGDSPDVETCAAAHDTCQSNIFM